MEVARYKESKPKPLSIAVIIYYSYFSLYDAVSPGSEQNMASTSTKITNVWALIFKEAETNRSLVWKTNKQHKVVCLNKRKNEMF